MVNWDELPEHAKEAFEAIKNNPQISRELSKKINMPDELKELIKKVIIRYTAIGKDYMYTGDDYAKKLIMLALQKAEKLMLKTYKI